MALPAVALPGWVVMANACGRRYNDKLVGCGGGEIAVGGLQRVVAGDGAKHPLKLATPLGALAESVPPRIAPVGPEPGLRVMVEASVVTTLPTASSTFTVKAGTATPAVVLPGWEPNTSLAAAPGTTVKGLVWRGQVAVGKFQRVIARGVAVDGVEAGHALDAVTVRVPPRCPAGRPVPRLTVTLKYR